MTIQIIQKCAAHNEAAQRQVFDRYGDLLFRIAFRYLNDKMAAEDAVANAFIKIFRKAGKGTFEKVADFEAWIRRIVINESLSLLRKKYRFLEIDVIDRGRVENESDHALSEMAAQEILSLIRKLPLGYRTVLNLFAIEGYTHPEISQLLGISIGTSKSQLSKARAMLRKKMNQLKQYEY